MPGPGEYLPDPTEGITRIEDLPQPKIRKRSRNYRRRPCPRCGHSAYRDQVFRRTLHDLGDLVSGRPCDLILTYSQHYCSACHNYFNADMHRPGRSQQPLHQTRRRHGRPLRRRGWLAVPGRQLAPLAGPSRLRPLRHDPELGRGRGKKATRRIETEYLDWALADFSGYIAADELYDGPFCMLSHRR